MTKQRRNSREGKKKPAMTPKEKKAAKKARRSDTNILDNDKTR